MVRHVFYEKPQSLFLSLWKPLRFFSHSPSLSRSPRETLKVLFLSISLKNLESALSLSPSLSMSSTRALSLALSLSLSLSRSLSLARSLGTGMSQVVRMAQTRNPRTLKPNAARVVL